MKYAKLFTIIAVICMFAFVTVWAQDTKAAAPAAAPAKVEKKAEIKAEKKAEKKAEAPMFKGKVTAVDAVKNTFTVERGVTGKDGKPAMKDGKPVMKSMTFEAGKDIKIADIAKDAKVKVTFKKDGDKVIAESVKPVEEKKIEKKAEAKKEVKKEEKKADAPKEEPKK
jgi:hypothetical protein